MRFLLILLASVLLPSLALGQTEPHWKIHDMERPRPAAVSATPALMTPPPSDAVVLFDGDDLDEWAAPDGSAPRWALQDGYMESVRGSGGLQTKRSFGDVQLHVEFALPDPPKGTGQNRGNSGVKLMGLYEVQVLDSHEDFTYADGQAGAIYGQSPPLVNASLPPGEWQSFDIIFRRPRFRPDGSVETKARLTVFHNGVLIQDHHEAWGPTRWLQYMDHKAHPDRLPLLLQDHANPVRFRNIWLRELAETAQPGPAWKPAPEVTQFTTEELERYAGRYDGIEGNKIGFRLAVEDGRIYLAQGDRQLDIVTNSATHFSMRFADADLRFTLGPNGEPERMVFRVGRHEFPTAKRK